MFSVLSNYGICLSLIPNLGYLSEAAASLMSRRLQFGIVPRTEVIALSSPIFHYSASDRRRARKSNTPLPEKVGSFQLFLHGYKDATQFLKEYPLPSDFYSVLPKLDSENSESVSKKLDSNSDIQLCPTTPCQDGERKQSFEWKNVFQNFHEGFEKMVVLDYIIRNTGKSI
jgi:hypothetical protein